MIASEREQYYGLAHPPGDARTPVIRRPRLLRRLAGESNAAILMAVAPSGYGKTTLLAQWDQADPRDFIWLPLDQRHDEPTMLIGAIATALDSSEPLDDSVFAPLMAPRPNIWTVVIPRVADALAKRERPFVLVLDDLHRIHDLEALDALAMVAEAIPRSSHLVVGSREHHRLPVGRLRTQRRVVELGADQLAMTVAEAHSFMRRLGIKLGRDEVESLVTRTEGWPAGLYLAALTIQASDDPKTALANICGDDRLIAEYVREVFLAGLAPAERSFLVRSSVLDRLSAPVCDSVLESVGSREVLKQLADSNLLLMPMDRSESEFRCHSLLREVLTSELRHSDVEDELALHRRAHEWFAEHGDVERAVTHAIAAGDRELAAQVIWSVTPAYESGGRHARVGRWLEEFADFEIERSPQLCLARAVGRTTLGDGIGCEHWIRLALGLLDDLPPTEAAAFALTAQVVRAAGAPSGGVIEMRTATEQAEPLLPDDSPWRALCCLLEGVSWHLTGEPDRAISKLDEGARRGEAAVHNVGTLCLSQRALIALDGGDLDFAAETVARAESQIELYGLGELPTCALSFASAALVLSQTGEPSKASAAYRRASALLAELNDFSPWYEAETRTVLARAAMHLDDVPSARSLLAEAGRYLQRAPDAELLRTWIEAGWTEVETAETVDGRWALSPAELRLLKYLPSHLNFREIADELFVSFNTVKSQASSIYRKLDVSSRGEAVDCAHRAGLLPAVRSGALSRESGER